MELCVGQPVDQGVFRQRGVLGFGQTILRRHRDARNGHLAHVTRHDGALAIHFAHSHVAVLIHAGNLAFVGNKIRQARYVTRAAIRVMRLHNQPLQLPLAVQTHRRLHAYPLKLGLVFALVHHAITNPLYQHALRFGSGFDAPARLMRHGECRLLDDQALLWKRREHPPTACVLDNLAPVILGIVGEYRELESILAIRLGVACARVAASLTQDRQHVIHQAQWLVLRTRRHRHFKCRLVRAVSSRHHRLAGTLGSHDAFSVHRCHLGLVTGKFCEVRHVHLTLGHRAIDQQPLLSRHLQAPLTRCQRNSGCLRRALGQ